jgi:hypothetical protein
VQLGSRYHDGKPGEAGQDWWGNITMPIRFRPLRPLIIRGFDRENVRTLAGVKKYAET